MGEFGALVIITGNLPYKTQVSSVFIFSRIESGDQAGAAAVAVVLLTISFALLLRSASSATTRRGTTVARLVRRYGLRGIALTYLAAILIGPLSVVFYRTFENGFDAAWDALSSPETIHAFKLTLIITAIAVPANTVFGIACGLAIVRRKFRGKGIVNAFVDLPLALSPVVVGLSLYLLYGQDGWFGGWLDGPRNPGALRAAVDGDRHDLRLAAVRRARGRPDAARDRRRAGAGGSHARRLVAGRRFAGSRCPSIRWAVIYGVILTTARCLGEFGAVAVVSGSLQGETETATLRVEERYQSLRPRRRLRDLDRARRARRARARRHDRDQTQGGGCLVSIVVKGVSKRFDDFPALENVSLDVETGSLTALLGPSGSGKSTLLRVIAGLEQPDEGEVVIFGDDATGVAPQKRGVGFVFQHYAAFKHMTVCDNVAFGLTIRKRPKDEIKRSRRPSCSSSCS